MRAPALAVLAIVCGLLAGCGDDGKQGTRGAPAAAPPAPSAPAVEPGPAPSPTPPTPGTPGTPAPTPAATPIGAPVAVRVGDWLRWRVTTTGGERATLLTWRVDAVEATRILLRVESAPLDAGGATGVATSTATWVPTPTSPSAGSGEADRIPVGARTVLARPVVRGDFTTWYAPDVPLGGLVQSRGPGGVEQVLVDFGRGS